MSKAKRHQADQRESEQSDAETRVEIHPVTPDRWADMVDLFERPGPRGGRQVSSGCWCMYWRLDNASFDQFWGRGDERGAGNKAAMGEIVAAGRVPGLLAYTDGQALGWVSVAPREEFPRVEKSRALRPVDDEPVWSIVCFYIHRTAHGRGIGRALLDAAVEHARSAGARIVEGYAVEAGDGDPYTGFRSMFEACGFRVVRPGGRRSIMRRELGDGRA